MFDPFLFRHVGWHRQHMSVLGPRLPMLTTHAVLMTRSLFEAGRGVSQAPGHHGLASAELSNYEATSAVCVLLIMSCPQSTNYTAHLVLQLYRIGPLAFWSGCGMMCYVLRTHAQR